MLEMSMFNTPVTVISVASAVAAFIATYYSLFISHKPEVFASSAKMKTFLDQHVKTLKKKFYPAPLFIEGRLQTVFGLTQRYTLPKRIPYKRELFALSDGGEVGLDYMTLDSPKGVESEKPLLVFILPGLTSSSQTSYVRTLVQELNKSGASVVVFNHRGNGGVPYKTPRTHSASYIGDLEEVIPYIRKKFPNHRIIGLGTSLGGMVLSKYLVSKPAEAKEALECAILISIAWDCVRGIDNLAKPFINKYLINKALTQGLVKLGTRFSNSFENVPLNFDPKQAIKAKNLEEFDSAFTAPHHGFSSALEYYKSATTSGNVHKYSIPVFALNATDDPMQPGNLLPTDEALEENSKLALIVTSHGGHLGWIEGFSKSSQHYMERLVGELIQAIRLYGIQELSGV